MCTTLLAKVKGGRMTSAQMREAAVLAKIHCDNGIEEMRTAESQRDFAKAAGWFRSALQLDPHGDRAAELLQSAEASQASLASQDLLHAPPSPAGSDTDAADDLDFEQMAAVRRQLDSLLHRLYVDEDGLESALTAIEELS